MEYNEGSSTEKIAEMLAVRLERLIAEQERLNVLHDRMDQEKDAISGRLSAIESKLSDLEGVEGFVKRTLDERMNNRPDPVQERVDVLVERWNVYQRDAVTGQGLSAIELKLSVLEEFFLELTAILDGRPSD